MRNKRRSYSFGVEWIAFNDDPQTTDVDEIRGYVSTLLLADLFSKDPWDVARDIAKVRGANNEF